MRHILLSKLRQPYHKVFREWRGIRVRKVFRVFRGLRAFVNLDIGLFNRGEVPDPERKIRAQARLIEQLRSQLSERDQREALWEGGKDFAAWVDGIAPEINHWRGWLVSKGLDDPEDYKRRLDPNQPLQEYVIEHLNAPPGAAVSILDVGAGPLTTLGKRWAGRKVSITAVDPLAHQYESLFAELNMTPPVRTQSGEVESLTERFPADYFDLVNVQNALDHSYDPLLGIRQMLQVVKSGCYVLLLHTVNEAENMSYAGFHQWNFCADNGDFVIWNRETRLCVNEVLGDEANVTVKQSEADQQLLVSLRKS